MHSTHIPAGFGHIGTPQRQHKTVAAGCAAVGAGVGAPNMVLADAKGRVVSMPDAVAAVLAVVWLVAASVKIVTIWCTTFGRLDRGGVATPDGNTAIGRRGKV